MGLAETANLVARLSLKDDLSGKIGGVESKVGRMNRALGTTARNLSRIGVVAGTAIAGAFALAIKQGIGSLEDLERVQNLTAATIKSTGSAAGVTAQKVRDLAIAQENLTTADDKIVQAGENMLLTFTAIGKDIFPRATAAMVNMGIAMNGGSIEGLDLQKTAIQLGKAMQDPVKGATALRKSGVALSDQQQKQIKNFVKLGQVGKAQAIILTELEKEFGKAGAAAGTGFGADMRRFDDAVEESRMALASGFLPVLSKVAKFLTNELAKPSTVAMITKLGNTLAGAFDEAVTFAQKIPWSSIADAMSIAGAGARAIFDVFNGMPDWVKTAVITGWGVNKITGGLITDLGKGLIKGVLGMTAGVVNINAGVVNGGGLGGGLGGAVAGVGGKVGLMALVAEAIPFVLGATAVLGVALAVAGALGADKGAGGTGGLGTYNGRTTIANRGGRGGYMPSGGGGQRAGSGRVSPLIGDTRSESVGGLRGLNPGVATSLRLVDGFTKSTSPSMKSMESHLRDMKRIEQNIPHSDRTNSLLITAAVKALGDRIAAMHFVVQATAKSSTKATTAWNKSGNTQRMIAS
jgi:hypothetical protein